MDFWIYKQITPLSLPLLLGVIAVCIYLLGKGADVLVEEAVTLSGRWKIPRVVIGATIVSLGTTLPEAAVSVWAAVQGRPTIALGNAVGSIICDTGLVLGLSAIIAPLPLLKSIVHRQGRLQLAAGLLLVVGCVPFCCIGSIFIDGGVLPQWFGFVFLFLLLAYLWFSVTWLKKEAGPAEEAEEILDTSSGKIVALRFVLSVCIILAASRIMIQVVQETAIRIGVPEGIIGATMVAFGTSLPELVTAIASVRKGHGELAVGNVIGANILNVFFVAGAAAAVTAGGLNAPAHFFRILFPVMLFVLLVFGLGVNCSKEHMHKSFGFVLLTAYILSTVVSYSYLHLP